MKICHVVKFLHMTDFSPRVPPVTNIRYASLSVYKVTFWRESSTNKLEDQKIKVLQEVARPLCRRTRPLFPRWETLGLLLFCCSAKTQQSNVSSQLAKIHSSLLPVFINFRGSNLFSTMLNKLGIWDPGYYVHPPGPWISAILPKWWKFAQITLILLTWFDKNFSCTKDNFTQNKLANLR